MATAALIPRKVLFSNPDKASIQLSPDGAHLAYLARMGAYSILGCRPEMI